jgi:hypothetical protein
MPSESINMHGYASGAEVERPAVVDDFLMTREQMPDESPLCGSGSPRNMAQRVCPLCAPNR